MGVGGVLLHSPKLHFQRWPPHRGCVLRAAFQGVTAHPDGSPPRSWLTVYNLISPDDCTEKATMMTMMKGEDPLGSELQSVGNRFFVGSCHPFQLSLRVMRSVKRFVFFFLSHHPTHAAVGQICKAHTFIFGPLPIILRVTEYFKKTIFFFVLYLLKFRSGSLCRPLKTSRSCGLPILCGDLRRCRHIKRATVLIMAVCRAECVL